MTRREVEALQRELNEFTRERVDNITPLIVDGKRGELVNRRVRRVKYWLGYHHPIDAKVDTVFMRRLRHPSAKRWSDPNMIRRGQRRRVRQREAMKDNLAAGAAASGVRMYDGKPVAAHFVARCEWARNHGWQGRVVSGYRTPAYSISLCMNMCGRPACSGTCAGASSRHAQKGKNQGAVDVSDYTRFGQLMKQCPIRPPVYNALPRDRVHFSTSGN